ncbi:hypothetical protein KI688_010903 [Linnemannia hyalina]|uniref:Protein kinase domain-containing protein n=1 Tax=Linnemannia hyalina TaxID=64524 RepID=A0A9P7XWX6_9FUNG|nr:hypothetical protein KI688_010903 [Linnemannia hyalina]
MNAPAPRKPLFKLDMDNDNSASHSNNNNSSYGTVSKLGTVASMKPASKVSSSSAALSTSGAAATSSSSANTNEATSGNGAMTGTAGIFSKLINRVGNGNPIGGSRHAKLGVMMPPSSVSVGLGGSVGGARSNTAASSSQRNNTGTDTQNRNGNEQQSSKKMPPPVGGSPRRNPYSRPIGSTSGAGTGPGKQVRTLTHTDMAPSLQISRALMPREWCLDDFELVRPLGKGQFGRVYSMRERRTGFVVAMKVLLKSELLNANMEHQLRREIDIQSNLK